MDSLDLFSSQDVSICWIVWLYMIASKTIIQWSSCQLSNAIRSSQCIKLQIPLFLANIPYFAEWTCLAWRQKTNPYLCLISMNITGWTPEYPNCKCWKYDLDRLSRFWVKSRRRIYSSRCVYLGKYGKHNWQFTMETLRSNIEVLPSYPCANRLHTSWRKNQVTLFTKSKI